MASHPTAFEEDSIVIKGKYQLIITKPLLSCFFDLSVEDTAICLEVSMNTVKRLRCWFGVNRWPYRLLCSRNVVASLMNTAEKELSSVYIPEAYAVRYRRDETKPTVEKVGGRKVRQSIVSRAERILGKLTLEEVRKRRLETIARLQDSKDQWDKRILGCLRVAELRTMTKDGYYNTMGIELPPDEEREFEAVCLRALREQRRVEVLPATIESPDDPDDDPDALWTAEEESSEQFEGPARKVAFPTTLSQECREETGFGEDALQDAFEFQQEIATEREQERAPVQIKRPRWAGGNADEFHKVANRSRMQWTATSELEEQKPVSTGDEVADAFMEELRAPDPSVEFVDGEGFSSHVGPLFSTVYS